jgi:glutaminyl-peptide cyclotransferase
MKRYAIIALLILVLGAFILVPFMRSSGSNTTDEPLFATFELQKDIQTEYGRVLPLNFSVPEGVKKVELIYNDSIFNTWNNPAKKITYPLKAYFFGIGTRVVVLRSYQEDGTTTDDAHMIRVVSDIAPASLKASIIQTYSHNPQNYTQGLEFNNGKLYEGTGDPGQQGKTVVGPIDLKSGAFMGPKNGLDANYFGEGITIFGDELFQITWKNGKCFVYDKNTMILKRDYSYPGDGWGLCNDGKYLIMSDGSERIYFRDPKTFQIVRTIEVYDNVAPRTNINELEFIDGKIYANIYSTSTIIAIDPNTGKVLEDIDGSELVAQGQNGGDVLNGIAQNPQNKKIYMTGKYWTKLFEVKLTPIK